MIWKRNVNRSLGLATLVTAIAALLVVAVGGCAPQADVATEEVIDVAAEEAAIRQMLQDWVVATNQPGQAGAEGYASFLTEDAAYLPPNDERVDGRDAVQEHLLRYTEAEGFTVTWAANHVEVSAAGDLAYALGTYELSMQDADGNTVDDRGKFADSLRKQADGSWKASSVMFSSDLPVAAPME